jgi:phosphoglycolate phosphatase
MSKLALFDIDGTLLSGTTEHYAAFVHAWRHVYGIPKLNFDWRDHGAWLRYEGKTDAKLMLEVAEEHGIRKAGLMLGDAVKAESHYYIENSCKEHLRVLPGVTSLLNSLRSRGVCLAIVSGNTGAIGRKKLSMAGLSKYFPVGAFGDRSLHREQLVKEALETAASHYEKDFSRKDSYFFGDTLRDMKAAKAAKIRGISVATGAFDMETLKKHRPFALFANLSNNEAILTLMGLEPDG